MSAEKEKNDQKPKKGFSFLKLALFLLMVVLIACVSMYAFMGINPADLLVDGFSGIYNKIFTTGIQEVSEKVKTVARYDTAAGISCAVISNELAVADKSSVKIYDSEGREKAYIPVNLQKPYIQSYKKNILVVDLEGKYFCLANESGILWEKTIDEEIVNAELSDKWILLITKSKQTGYKRTIRAYSTDGQEICFRNVSNYYPYSIYHYPEFNESCFIVNGIEASGLEATGLFEFLDPAMNQKASIRGENEIFGGVLSAGKHLFIYGENSLTLIDESFNTIWDKKLAGYTATAAGVIQGKYPVVAELNTEVLSRESRHETTVNILNEDSSEKAKLIIDDLVAGITSKGKTTALTAGSEAFFINSSGKITDRYTSKSDITSVYLANEDLAYVVSGGTINRVKIKVNKFLGLF
jgi:hypothetical protein